MSFDLTAAPKLGEVNLDTGDFLTVVLNSRSVQDLEAVLEAVQEEMDAPAKAAGSSETLAALKELVLTIKRRMTVLEASGSPAAPLHSPTAGWPSAGAQQFPITVVLTNHVAISFFSDFLAQAGRQHFLDCYMAIEGFKSSVEHQLRALACGSASDPDFQETMRDAALFLYRYYLAAEVSCC